MTDEEKGKGGQTYQITEKTSIALHPVDSKDADLALHYAKEGNLADFVGINDRSFLIKIDLYIMPLVCLLMSCQLMDKSSNSYASIMGLREDLNMSGLAYSWVGSSFYLAFLVFQFPANLLLQRFPLSKVLGSAVIIWGIVLCCHGTVQSSSTFLLCRTLLGCFESFMTSAYIILTSQWYKRSEQYIRCAYWMGFQGFGTMLGSGIAYGLYTHDTESSLASWRLLFVILGVITIFCGIVSIIHIPDVPAKAWFLTQKEKEYTVERIRENNQGFGNRHFKLHQFKEALTDVTSYLLFLYTLSYGISNGGMGNFGSILLEEDFGFSTGTSLLMNMVGSGIDIVFPLTFAYIQLKFIKSRLVVCFIINSMNVIGLFMLAYSSFDRARLVGYYLNYLLTASYATMASIVASNVAGHTKKVTVSTFFFIGFCTGNLIGPQLFLGSEADESYPTAKKVMSSTSMISLITPLVLLVIYYYRNKSKAKTTSENEESDKVDEDIEFADLTDVENLHFRYHY